MTTLPEFVDAVTAELELPANAVDVDLVLDLAREVAHQVLRPGAPVSAYLLGLAVGRGGDPVVLAERLTTLAHRMGASNG
jgi:hypothetical protein